MFTWEIEYKDGFCVSPTKTYKSLKAAFAACKRRVLAEDPHMETIKSWGAHLKENCESNDNVADK